jgi:hypothetical protein
MKTKLICAVLCGMLLMWFVAPMARDGLGLQKVSAAGNLNVAVLCSSCQIGNFSGMVLLDQNTGKIWVYDDAAIVGLGEPKFIGKIIELGKKPLRQE